MMNHQSHNSMASHSNFNGSANFKIEDEGGSILYEQSWWAQLQ